MTKNYLKRNKKESLFTKLMNCVLTLLLACLIGSQMCPAANNNLRIAQVSDAHFSSYEDNTSYKILKQSGGILDDAIMQINTSGPYDFVMFTGDLINTPKVSELEQFIKHANMLVYPWYALNGNHDISVDGPLTKSKFMSVISGSKSKTNSKKSYYSFTPKQGYRVICLDTIIDNKITTKGEVSKEQLDWLREELGNHAKDTIIVCLHVPIIEPFSSPNHKLINDYEVKKILKSHKNPVIILQGHYHAARIVQDDNLLVVSCPSLVTYPNAYRVINVNTNKKNVKVDVYLKETNLKEAQMHAKIRLMGSQILYGEDSDRNASYELRREK